MSHNSRGIGLPHSDRPTPKSLPPNKFDWLKSREQHSKLVDSDCSKSYRVKLPAGGTWEEQVTGQPQGSQHRISSSTDTAELLNAAEMALLSVNEKTYVWKLGGMHTLIATSIELAEAIKYQGQMIDQFTYDRPEKRIDLESYKHFCKDHWCINNGHMLPDDQLGGSVLRLPPATLRAQMRATVAGTHLGRAEYLTGMARWATIGSEYRLLSTIVLN